MNNIIELKKGLTTAFIDGTVSSNLAFKPQLVSNNYKEGKKVLSAIEDELLRCDEFYISVAFITMSGITPLLQTFRELAERGVKGYILTTDYLSFSEPKAIERLQSLSNIEIKMYLTGNGEGFHTKGYLFKCDGIYKAIIGSSNLTLNAITRNKEWNTKLVSAKDGEFAKELFSEFDALWNSKKALDYKSFIEEYTIRYEAIKEQKKIVKAADIPDLTAYKLEPNCMQIRFIENLRKLQNENQKRALLLSATGTGKTYASAFALRDNKSKRVLFIVHREQIAKQAMVSFKKVFGNTRTYGLLSGNSKDTESDFVFATMQTVSKDENLYGFKKDEFETIVIDEAHRTGAYSYQKIMDYFKPNLWLGMTASPERTDGFDVYAAFHHNIAYEIRLQQAMEEDLLCPFHYFGIVDFTVDGEVIDDKTQFNYLVDDKRVDYIIEQAKFYGYSGDRVKGLVFARSKKEATKLSEMFNERGYKTKVLTGDSSISEREDAIERLVTDDKNIEHLDYIFTVDIFNEGVDIPEINQVIMLRPTESPIVFVQQLGRGLRKSEGKEYVVILDFIGNYENNYMIPIALSGDRSYNKDSIRKFVREGCRVLAGSSTVHFDKITKSRVFESINNFNSVKKVIRESYRNLRYKLGRVPLMIDFYQNGEVDPRVILENYKSYYEFLNKIDKEFINDERFKEDISSLDLDCLEYLSKTVGRGKRPHEAEILNCILCNGSISVENAVELLEGKYGMPVNSEEITSAIHNLGGYFVSKDAEKARFSVIDLIEERVPGHIEITDSLVTRLKNRTFKALIEDIVNTAIAFIKDNYTNRRNEEGFILYEKYSRRDVCQILNCNRDLTSTMYGMKRIDDDACLFVTYNKEEAEEGKVYVEGKPDYADEFVDSQTFMWDSQINRRIDSSYVREVKDASNIRLFVKKSDGEGTDFYYMGKVDVIELREAEKKDNKGNMKPITKFKFKLKNEVREDIFDYLHNE